jgi:hypothetical protein
VAVAVAVAVSPAVVAHAKAAHQVLVLAVQASVVAAVMTVVQVAGAAAVASAAHAVAVTVLSQQAASSAVHHVVTALLLAVTLPPAVMTVAAPSVQIPGVTTALTHVLMRAQSHVLNLVLSLAVSSVVRRVKVTSDVLKAGATAAVRVVSNAAPARRAVHTRVASVVLQHQHAHAVKPRYLGTCWYS